MKSQASRARRRGGVKGEEEMVLKGEKERNTREIKKKKKLYCMCAVLCSIHNHKDVR